MKKAFSRRLLSAFLAVLLCFTCIGSPAVFAAEAQPPATSTPESVQAESDLTENTETEPTGDSLAGTTQENDSADVEEPEDP